VKGAGGAGRRREGAQARRLIPPGVRLATGVEKRRERTSKLGRCLTVARGFDRPQRAGRSRVLEPGRRDSGLALEARWLGPRRQTRQGQRTPAPCVDVRDRTRNRAWGMLSRGNAQESTDAAASPWPGHGVAGERTPGGSKASKRACWLLTGEPGLNGNADLPATRECEPWIRSAVAGNRRHGSCVSVHLRVGSRQRAGATRKAIVKDPCRPRWRQSDANPHGSNGPRERVRLPGKGKLCRAAPKRRERHVTRPRSVGTPRRNGEPRKGS
jgi:hypothetical protein